VVASRQVSAIWIIGNGKNHYIVEHIGRYSHSLTRRLIRQAISSL